MLGEGERERESCCLVGGVQERDEYLVEEPKISERYVKKKSLNQILTTASSDSV